MHHKRDQQPAASVSFSCVWVWKIYINLTVLVVRLRFKFVVKQIDCSGLLCLKITRNIFGAQFFRRKMPMKVHLFGWKSICLFNWSLRRIKKKKWACTQFSRANLLLNDIYHDLLLPLLLLHKSHCCWVNANVDSLNTRSLNWFEWSQNAERIQ